MIDTHTHLYLADSFPDAGEAAVGRALKAGVDTMVLPAIDRESTGPLLELNSKFPDNTAVALGLHPTEVEADWKAELNDIMGMGEDTRTVAIGEIGLDLHWEQKYLSRQMDAFGEQIQIALDRDLPVIIHSRDALEETVEVLKNFSDALPPLVFHSFTSGRKETEKLLETAPEAFFGINGVVTFKNASALREAVEWLDIGKIVTETDSPFLAPVPFRGRTNESAYIPYIVRTLASLKNISEEEMADITTENALRLFPLISRS